MRAGLRLQASRADCPPPRRRRRRSTIWPRTTAPSARSSSTGLTSCCPTGQRASEADLGVALAELIAYVGDHLSYRQDAVATEAYLETARSRISLRRHALLVDYHIQRRLQRARLGRRSRVAGSRLSRSHADALLHLCAGHAVIARVGAGNEPAALISGVLVFEPMQDARLYPEHNQMHFYTWGDTDCCLPTGATEATLLGTFPNLQVGDV